MRARAWTRATLAYFALATAALVWPVYPALGNHVEPRVFGLPWSLTYILLIVALNTAVLAVMYTRDRGRDEEDDRG